MTPSLQDHIERLLGSFDYEFPSEDGYDYFGMERISRVKSFLSSSLHSLAETQKEKALEVVRRYFERELHANRRSPLVYEALAKDRSEVEEALKKEL